MTPRAAGLKTLRARLEAAEARQAGLDSQFEASLERGIRDAEQGRTVPAEQVLRELRAMARKPLVERSATRRKWAEIARGRLRHRGPFTAAGRLLADLQEAFCAQECRPRRPSPHLVHPLATLDVWADAILHRRYGNAGPVAVAQFAQAFHVAACYRTSERPLGGGLSRVVLDGRALYYAERTTRAQRPRSRVGLERTRSGGRGQEGHPGIIVLAWANIYRKESFLVDGPPGVDGELLALEWLDLAVRKKKAWVRTAVEALGVLHASR